MVTLIAAGCGTSDADDSSPGASPTWSIDLLTVPQLGAAVLEAVSDQPRGLIIDLTATDFLASSGIAALLAAHAAITPVGRFGVVAEHPAVTRPLQLSGLDRTLGVYPTLADAFAAMVSPR